MTENILVLQAPVFCFFTVEDSSNFKPYKWINLNPFFNRKLVSLRAMTQSTV